MLNDKTIKIIATGLILIMSVQMMSCENTESLTTETSADMITASASTTSEQDTQTSTSEAFSQTTTAEAETTTMGSYPIFWSISFEEQQKINRWLSKTADTDFFYYYAPENKYFFSDAAGNSYSLTPNPTGGIYSLDGETYEVHKLSDDSAIALSVHDDWLYYINITEFNMLFKMRLDGTERQCVMEHSIGDYDFVGDKIYFVDYFYPKYYVTTGKFDVFSMKHQRLSRINFDGSGYEVVSEKQLWPIYYMEPYLYAKENDWNLSLSNIWRFDPADIGTAPIQVGLDQSARMLFFTKDGRECWRRYVDLENQKETLHFLYMRDADGNTVDIASWVEAIRNFGIINGEIYGDTTVLSEHKTVLCKFDAFSHISPVMNTKYPSPTRYAFAGNLILVKHPDGMTIVSPDGSVNKPVFTPAPPLDKSTIGAVQQRIAELKDILRYFEALGIYDGETINFESVPELGYQAPIKNFFVFAEAPTSVIPRLLELNEQELLETGFTVAHAEGLLRRFKYLEELVKRVYGD